MIAQYTTTMTSLEEFRRVHFDIFNFRKFLIRDADWPTELFDRSDSVKRSSDWLKRLTRDFPVEQTRAL